MADSYPLSGSKVELRAFQDEDAPALQAFLNHPGLDARRYIPREFPVEGPLSEAVVSEILDSWRKSSRSVHYAVVLPTTSEIIGHCGVSWHWDPICPDVDVVISPLHQRQGFGMEALGLLLEWVFGNLPANVVGTNFPDWSEGAQAFFSSAGFTFAGQSRREGLRQGRYYDLVVMDLLRAEWIGRNSLDMRGGRG